MSEHDQGPAYEDCNECNGVGHKEIFAGARPPGLGGIEPVIREERCEDCNGDGFVEREKDAMAEEIERLSEQLESMQRLCNLADDDRANAEAQRDELLNCLKDMVKYYPCGCAPPDRCCCVCASYAAIARCEP